MGSSLGPGLGSSLGPGLGSVLGPALGDTDGDVEGDTEGDTEGEGDTDGDGDTVGPATWSEPPLQVPGAFPGSYQPVEVSKQLGPASLPLLRQKVAAYTLSLITQSRPDQS